MNEQENQNLKDQKSPKNEGSRSERLSPKSKTAIMIGAAATVVIAIVVVLILLLGGNNNNDNDNNNDNSGVSKETKYQTALSLIETKEYTQAYALLKELGNYKDSEQYISKFHYVPTSIIKNCYGETENITISLGDNNLPETILVVDEYEGDRYEDKYEYTYDSNGNITLLIITDDIGDISTITYEYDTNGNVTKSRYEDATTIYTYDNRGNLIREQGAYSGITYTYDANNNLIKETNDYGSFTTYIYDNNNRMIQSIYYIDESRIIASTEYAYDTNGNLTQKVETNISGITYPVGAKITYNYTYDANGNLIESMEGVTDNDPGWKTTYTYTFVYIPMDMSDESIHELISDFK